MRFILLTLLLTLEILATLILLHTNELLQIPSLCTMLLTEAISDRVIDDLHFAVVVMDLTLHMFDLRRQTVLTRAEDMEEGRIGWEPTLDRSRAT